MMYWYDAATRMERLYQLQKQKLDYYSKITGVQATSVEMLQSVYENKLVIDTKIKTENEENRIKLSDPELPTHPYLYLTGHGNIRLNDEEIIALRDHLLNGGFLHADDNYGMDESFRREIKKVFPNKDFVQLPKDHAIFNSYYKFENGLPKIHEHDKKPPQALALFEGEKILVLYTYESDLGDGWENLEIHNDPQEIRLKALQMGANIINYAFLN